MYLGRVLPSFLCMQNREVDDFISENKIFRQSRDGWIHMREEVIHEKQED